MFGYPCTIDSAQLNQSVQHTGKQSPTQLGKNEVDGKPSAGTPYGLVSGVGYNYMGSMLV